MNRRHFISALLGAGAGLALEEAIPFNRVWFFPKEIRLANNGLRGVYFHTFETDLWVPAGEIVFDPKSQIWIVISAPPPIDWKIFDARLIPSSPSGS